MALTQDDLNRISEIIGEKLKPIQEDISTMKADLRVIARLNQLDEIRKDARLKVLYADDQQHA